MANRRFIQCGVSERYWPDPIIQESCPKPLRRLQGELDTRLAQRADDDLFLDFGAFFEVFYGDPYRLRTPRAFCFALIQRDLAQRTCDIELGRALQEFAGLRVAEHARTPEEYAAP